MARTEGCFICPGPDPPPVFSLLLKPETRASPTFFFQDTEPLEEEASTVDEEASPVDQEAKPLEDGVVGGSIPLVDITRTCKFYPHL